MVFKTPVLLLTWRRPDTLIRVIEVIRKVAPNQIYVACDGPNPDRTGEIEQVAATRAVIESEIDWPCHIERFYSDVNQGCRLGVSRAITWFFEHVNEGIILEDDCLPAESFFYFCEELLNRYREDTRIWQISGSIFFSDYISVSQGDYFFSRYGPIWGWATWKRAWSHYDSALYKWPEMSNSTLMKNIYPDANERRFKRLLGFRLYANQIDTWDYQWGMCKNYNYGLTVIPKKNQIVNIGFSDDATHTVVESPFAPTDLTEVEGQILHPRYVYEDMQYSQAFCRLSYKPRKLKFLKKLIIMLNQIFAMWLKTSSS